jgi:hypothetical protein
MHEETVLIFGNPSINYWFRARETKKTALVVRITVKFEVFSIFNEFHATLTQQRMMLLTKILVLIWIRQFLEIKLRFALFIIAFPFRLEWINHQFGLGVNCGHLTFDDFYRLLLLNENI